MRTDRKSAGYTLLEAVIAVTLMAVLVGMLLTGLRLGMTAWRRGEQKLAEQRQAFAQTEMLNRQITSAVPRMLVAVSDLGRVEHLSFRGAPSEMRFLTRSSISGDRSISAWLASYRVVATADGRQQLRISDSPVPDDEQLLHGLLAPADSSLQSEAIEAPAEQVQFWYLQPSRPQVPATWVSEWKAEERNELPRAVRVEWRRGKQVKTATFLVPVWRVER